jgi:hypothetical protein
MEALVKSSNLNIVETTNWEMKKKCLIMGDNTIRNHDFLKGSNLLTCHFLLMDVCIWLMVKGLTHIFVD